MVFLKKLNIFLKLALNETSWIEFFAKITGAILITICMGLILMIPASYFWYLGVSFEEAYGGAFFLVLWVGVYCGIRVACGRLWKQTNEEYKWRVRNASISQKDR